MRIVADTPERLIIKERPVIIAAMMALLFMSASASAVLGWERMAPAARVTAVALAIAVALIARLFIHWVTVDFERASARVEIARRGLFFYGGESYSLKHLEGARLDKASDPDRRSGADGASWRVVLVFSERMLGEPDRAEWKRRRGSRWGSARPNEVPLTSYYSAKANAEEVVFAINRWVGTGDEARAVAAGPGVPVIGTH